MLTRPASYAGRTLIAIGLALPFVTLGAAGAASSDVVGTASTYGVLGGSAVTNTGPSVITGDLGVSPGTAISGFPPGTRSGTTHAADAAAAQAQADATTAYNDLAGRAPDEVLASAELGGLTFGPGVYRATSSLGLTGTVTLDAAGDEDAVFVFQVGSELTTASSSVVSLIGAASPCNVYWQVGSSATVGTASDFVGTLIALTSITLTTGADVEGQLLARSGAVTLDTNDITAPVCAASLPATTTTSTTSTTAVDGAATTSTTTAGSATTTTVVGGGDTTTRTARPTSGGTTTGTIRVPGTPPLADTGSRLLTLLVGGLLVLVGVLLAWVGRRRPAHAAPSELRLRVRSGIPGG